MALTITPEIKQFLISKGFAQDGGTDDYYRSQIVQDFKAGRLDVNELRDVVIKGNFSPTRGNAVPNREKYMSGPTLTEIAASAGAGGAGTIRVKRASERYSKDSRPVIHEHTKQPLVALGMAIKEPSELALAKIGAFAKHYLSGQSNLLQKWGAKIPVLNDHERQLVEEMYHEDAFCGALKGNGWIDRATVEEAGLNVKALLDDSTSGGQNLVPFEFDSAIITYPFLHSQLLPYVDLRTATRSEVQTAALGQVTVSWGTNEGTEIPVFDTAGLLTNITCGIYPLTASIEWGKDWEADTPVTDFGQLLVQQFGEATKKELDLVIAQGNGTNRPEGILTKSGTVSVNSDNGAAGPPTLADYLKLLFGVALQYREQDLNAAFLSNDTVYMRSRQIRVDPHAVGTTVNQLPVFGMDFESYMTAGYRHAINNSIVNTTAAFVCLKKYVLYRRAGFDFRIEEGGRYLARSNKKLMVVRGRYGGTLADPNACSKMTDCQT